MARALLFLTPQANAEEQLTDSLLAQLESWATQSHCAIELRRQLDPAEDAFHHASPGYHTFPLTLDIQGPQGLPLLPLIKPLTDLPAQIDGLDAERSLALLGWRRQLIQTRPQPVTYLYLMCRKPGLTQADYLHHYADYHQRFGLETPGIEGYSQTLVDNDSSRQLAEQVGLNWRDVSSVSQLDLASMETFVAAQEAAGNGPQAHIDEQRFVDRSRAVMFSSTPLRRW